MPCVSHPGTQGHVIKLPGYNLFIEHCDVSMRFDDGIIEPLRHTQNIVLSCWLFLNRFALSSRANNFSFQIRIFITPEYSLRYCIVNPQFRFLIPSIEEFAFLSSELFGQGINKPLSVQYDGYLGRAPDCLWT